MNKEKLKWENLLERKCPKCGCGLYDDPGMNCENDYCDFFITEERFQQICKNLKQ